MKRVGLGLSLASVVALACMPAQNSNSIVFPAVCMPQTRPVPIKLRFNSSTTPQEKQNLIDVVSYLAHQTDSTERFVVADTATADLPSLAINELTKYAIQNPPRADTLIVYTLPNYIVGNQKIKPEDEESGNVHYVQGIYESNSIFLTQYTGPLEFYMPALFLHEIGHRYYFHSIGESVMTPTMIMDYESSSSARVKYAPAFLESRLRTLENKTKREGFTIRPKIADSIATASLIEGNRLFVLGDYDAANTVFKRGFMLATQDIEKRELELSVAYMARLVACGVWKPTGQVQ